MKISVTSDVHVRDSNPEAVKFLKAFLDSPVVLNSDCIIFLGDIFDLMVGPKYQYLEEFKFFFDKITELAKLNKKVIYIEGNHDFHIKPVFEKLDSPNISVVKGAYQIEDYGKKILFEHGDELDFNNKSYRQWKKIYSSKVMELSLKYIFPYRMIRAIGNSASKKSKKKSSKNFSYEFEKEKYRENFKQYSKNNSDIFIMGHTHIKDEFEYQGKVYLNNGYPPVHNQFIYIEDGQWKFVSALDSSK